MKLEQRIRKLEGRTDTGLAAVLYGYYTARDPNDPALTVGPDEDGEARLSPYWTVWFLEGNSEEQERELQELRRDPRFNHPPKENPNWIGGAQLFVQYITGGSYDMTISAVKRPDRIQQHYQSAPTRYTWPQLDAPSQLWLNRPTIKSRQVRSWRY
ncbi:MAG: hypothetical protein ACREQ7_14900 [Candidatus Binatia bacterium]